VRDNAQQHMRCILFNKPFHVLTRFTDAEGRRTLRDYIAERGVYPAGRLDYDSEGLLFLTDDGPVQTRISDPRFSLPKTYWAQVEQRADEEALARLLRGVPLNDGLARALAARAIEEPAGLWPRDPPIRYRARIPTSWLELTIDEGRNRQVRRMTAAVGLPTLRLIRAAIGPWTIDGLAPGQSRALSAEEVYRALRGRHR
jgi:23S rRNA pseudouridine2457 synthase